MANALNYESPSIRPPRFYEAALWRWLVLGPLTGTLVGFLQTTAAVIFWTAHGEPDFYFRGWPGVLSHYFLLTVSGGIVGLIYGFVLLRFEVWSRRRIRLLLVFGVVLVFGFVATMLIVYHEFRARKISAPPLSELTTIVFGALFTIATARRQSSLTNVN